MASNLVRKACNTLTKVVFNHNTNSVRLASYQAAILKEPGKPLVIESKKKQSSLKSDQVRISVKYCSVNSLDSLNFLNQKGNLPYTPGYELAGEVMEVGKKVSPEQIIVGERVAALSLDKFGGFAEECVVSYKFYY